MKKFFSMVCACLLALSAQATDIKKYDALYENLPFQMEKVTRPQFPANEVNLKDFGAIGDGSSLCTTAFAKAIDALTQKGGGKLIVPQGVWFTGPIVLKSNINLHLEKGAVILFSPDDALYPFIETSFEGLDTRRCQSPISGHHLTNVAITGQGCIDGNGEYWRPLKKQKVTDAQWKQITSRGGAFKRADYWFPSEGALKADNSANMNVPKTPASEEEWNEIKRFLRPVMISLDALRSAACCPAEAAARCCVALFPDARLACSACACEKSGRGLSVGGSWRCSFRPRRFRRYRVCCFFRLRLSSSAC